MAVLKSKAQSAWRMAFTSDALRSALCAMRKRFPLAHLPCALAMVVAVAAPLPAAAPSPPSLSVEECVEKCRACACVQDEGEWVCACLAPR
jgi:hypothetical protein